jgi:hypothetical protein
MSDTKKYTFFWKTDSPFSQWHHSEFNMDITPLIVTLSQTSIRFINTEQYMMFKKAEHFGDSETAKKILKAKHPREMKMLGRTVKNFSSQEWDVVKYNIVKEGNRLKFSQNPNLLKSLKDTAGTTLVEASPYDQIWGIGLSDNDPRALNEAQWRGQNLLGKILTELREELT